MLTLTLFSTVFSPPAHAGEVAVMDLDATESLYMVNPGDYVFGPDGRIVLVEENDDGDVIALEFPWDTLLDFRQDLSNCKMAVQTAERLCAATTGDASCCSDVANEDMRSCVDGADGSFVNASSYIAACTATAEGPGEGPTGGGGAESDCEDEFESNVTVTVQTTDGKLWSCGYTGTVHKTWDSNSDSCTETFDDDGVDWDSCVLITGGGGTSGERRKETLDWYGW